MKRKLTRKLLCLLLSGVLLAADVEMPSAYAQEETEVSQESAEEKETAETEAAESVSLAETEEAQQTEGKTEEAQQTEGKTEEAQTEDKTEEAQTEGKTEEAQTEGETEEAEPEESAAEDFSEEEKEELPEYSLLVVNPLYEDVIDGSELQKHSAIAEINAAETFDTVEKAAEYMRGQMVERQETIAFNVPASLISTDELFSAYVDKTFEAAIRHTEECSGQEGDALKWGCKGYKVNASSSDSGNYQVTFTVAYHSTYEQEQQLTAAVDSALADLSLDGRTDYEKVKLIHDYICDHVDYDYDLKKYSAYDAMCTGASVCQGYAVLFYRMCKDAGLSVRLVSGKGNGGAHGWNIVRIGSNARAAGEYYNVDCTWDGQSAVTHWTYFLKSEEDFFDHERAPEYKTEEFLAAYPVSAESYFDDSVKLGLNADNIAPVTLWTLEEKTVSTDASRKPKVLIFYSTTCYRSQNTLRSAAAYAFNYDEVDIYAVAGNGTDDDIKSFKATYGNSNNIIYTSSNSRAMNAYTGILDDMNYSYTFNTPVVCYIDVNNKFQHATFGATTGAEIAANLKQYCSGVIIPASYRITYVLDGGENDTRNPSVYISGSEALTLYPAVKEGCTFAGWYKDNGFTMQVTQIEEGLTGNLELYAKWEDDPNYEYTITYELDGGTNAPENPSVYTQNTETITLSDPQKEGCTFAGWYSDAAFTEKVTQIEKGSTGSITLYAKWIDNAAEYTITYELDGGTNASGNPSAYTQNTETITLSDPEKEGFTFAGWYKDAAFTERVIQIAKGSMGNITLYAKWTPVDNPDPSWFPKLDMTLTEGNILMGVSGEYYTETAETILNELNRIRKEACDEGIVYDGKTLTPQDYVPLKWSSDLEAIARVRAAEASLRIAHERPNGKGCFTAATTTKVCSNGENLAWNYEGLMAGIKQWYDEKNDLINKTGGETGHYTSMINPAYQYVAVSAFSLSKGAKYPYTVSQEFSMSSDLDSQKNDVAGYHEQDVEIAGGSVKKLAFDSASPIQLKEGGVYSPALNAAVTCTSALGEVSYTGPVHQGGVWRSSDEAAAIVDAKGNITGIKAGTAEISVAVGAVSAKLTVNVGGQEDDPENPDAPEPEEYPDKPETDVDLADKAVITVRVPNIISNGKADQKSDPIVTWKNPKEKDVDRRLVENYHYTVIHKDGKAAGERICEITAVPGSGFTGKAEASYMIYEKAAAGVKDVSRLTVKLGTKAFDYTGAAVTPKDITVSDGKTTLQRGTDYDILYKNNYNAGKASVIIVGSGSANASGTSYIGSKEVSFTIKKVNIKDLTPVYDKTGYKYLGRAVTVENLKLKLNEAYTLDKDDYTVSYKANDKPGTASFTIKAKGDNFTGSIPKQTFTIDGIKLNDIPKDALKTIAYSPKGARLSTISFDLGGNKVTLKEGRDYKVKYNNKANAIGDTLTATITGKNIDKGNTLPVSLTVAAADFSTVSAASESDLIIDAKKAAKKDSQIKVTDYAGAKLKPGEDYTLVWDTADTGSAAAGLKLTIKPCDTKLYTGEKVVEYRIANKLAAKDYKVADKHFDGRNPVEILAKDITGLEAGDYKLVNYKNNTRKGKASVTIEGRGRYYGRITLKFNILD